MLLQRAVLPQVGTGATIVVGAASQAGGAAITPSSLNHLLSQVSAVISVDTDTWSMCGASALQLAFAGVKVCDCGVHGMLSSRTVVLLGLP